MIYNYGDMIGNALGRFTDQIYRAGQYKNQMKLQEEQRQRQQQQDAAMQGLAELYATNPTTEQLYQYGLQNPAAYQRVADTIGFKNDQTRQIMQDTLISALNNPEQKDAIIQQGADAIKAAGGNPKNLLSSVGDEFGEFEKGAVPFLAYLGGQGANFAKSYMSMKPQSTAEQPMTPAQKAADERAKDRLKFDKERLEFDKERASKPKEKGMSVFTERTLNDAQNAAYESYSSSDSIMSLAEDYAQNKDKLGGGFLGSASESFKDFIGGEDEVSELKKNYARLRSSLVIKNLPPGPATDKDVQTFSKGFPSENSDPSYIESFLKGMAKSQFIGGKFNEFKANYISENGNTAGLMKAWKEASKGIQSEIDQRFPSARKVSEGNIKNLSDEDLLNG